MREKVSERKRVWFKYKINRYTGGAKTNYNHNRMS